MSVLSLNAGSSTLKFGLYADGGSELAAGVVEWRGDGVRPKATLRSPARVSEPLPPGADGYRGAVEWVVRRLRRTPLGRGQFPPAAVGHRVVHGGAEFREPVPADRRVRDAICRFSALAPLHNPAALECMAAADSALPGVPQAAVFDTALYADLPPRAVVYPVPYEWTEQWGVRRFGFHGVSHGYCLRRAGELTGRDTGRLRVVACHLGSGCSVTGFRNGAPAVTTMGYTPLDGLMMGTRAGSLDPGILLHLLRTGRTTLDQLSEALEHRSGVLGVSGVSADFRRVLTAAQDGNERARLALDLFADRVRAAVGATAVTIGGLDVLVFTGGIGEHAAGLREEVCGGLGCLGVRVDHGRNRECQRDADVSEEGSAVRVLVVAAREEAEVARLAAAGLGRK